MSYNPRKASQVVAFFALRSGEAAINVVKAMKLVYLADRENISRYGFPILDERRVSMPLGPVNSYTYNYIKGEVKPEYDRGWGEFLNDRAHHAVGLVDNSFNEDDFDELSDAEVETLETVWENFGAMNQWELVDYTHDPKNIPEWKDPAGYGSKTIKLESLLAAVGVPSYKDHAAEIESVNEASGFLKGL